MLANVEANWVPFPEGTAKTAAVLPCFEFFDLLRVFALVFFPTATEVVFIAGVMVVPISRCVIALSLVPAAASKIATLPTATRVCIACIACGLTALYRVVACREARTWVLIGWLDVIHDLFQKAVDVEFYRHGSLFNVSET